MEYFKLSASFWGPDIGWKFEYMLCCGAYAISTRLMINIKTQNYYDRKSVIQCGYCKCLSFYPINTQCTFKRC